MKSCPRCGGKVVFCHNVGNEWPSIWCPECETIWRPAAHAKEIVIDWWNRREGE